MTPYLRIKKQVEEALTRGVICYRIRVQNGRRIQDPCDLGRGLYYSTHLERAVAYGSVERASITLKNPLILNVKEAYTLAEKFGTFPPPWIKEGERKETEAKSVKEEALESLLKDLSPESKAYQKISQRLTKERKSNLPELSQNALAEKLTTALLQAGHDGMVVIRQYEGLVEFEIIDYRMF